MGCSCDALANERERKGEANMKRLIGSEINITLEELSRNIKNPYNKNEESDIYQQNNITLFELKHFKHEKRTDLRYKLMKNEENNLLKIREYEINNRIKDNILIKNKKQIILKENKNLSRVNNLPFNQEEVKDRLKFNRDLCKSLASSFPKRTKIEYQPFKDLLKSKTENLSDKEKSFVIFLWICDNIAYDTDSYYAGAAVDCTPKGVYKNGSSVCSGYSRLYKDFADYLNLEVECVSCYAKGEDYYLGKKMTSVNHEYNVIKLNNQWYPIDSAWVARHIKEKKYIKNYIELYFLSNPELLIKTHFPADDIWQLTKIKYTLEEFLKWPRIYSYFYTLGFEKFFPEEGLIELKDKNIQKFIIYGNIEQIEVTCDIYRLEGNYYIQLTDSNIVNFFKDRLEINTIFYRKGKYKVEIYGKKDREKYYLSMLEYAVNVENDDIKNLDFPLFYAGKENINVIEPLYDNLRSGEKVKFKIESNLNDIIIIDDDEWHHLKRNAQGYFEFETIIKTKKGSYVIIAHKTGLITCRNLVRYNVV